MKSHLKLILWFALLWDLKAYALDFTMGASMNSVTGALPVAGIHIGLAGSGWVSSYNGVGYRNQTMYLSHHLFGVYYQEKFASFISAGFGFCLAGSQRGMIADGELTENTEYDAGFGTMIKLKGDWPVFLAIEHFHGSPLDTITKQLSTRDVTHLILGADIL